MNLTILGASGAVGVELTRQALDRGHEVTAISRHPERLPDGPRLTRVAADVLDAESIAQALAGRETVVSALGVTDAPGVLTAGARAVVAAGPARVVWLGAFGTRRR
ncbi:sugar nucleotide-binding protein [Cryptosporangium phraense]|uniref:Sugar nucleotide-binding protein n=1 Tax=Cryptosporangium phraense TaxID=2593070 RepID=A0A545AM26_9ACTN|nr:NAD(P)H-binding protein [Cryptosporangium phraense]TQS42379.1 sugar nucleotide-binding protein [Cryptosporangium phraense]